MTGIQDSPEHHRKRSEFIRKFIQQPIVPLSVKNPYTKPTPRTIVQYWHNHRELPRDIGECVATWRRWEKNSFAHHLFDESGASKFIGDSFGESHKRAFERCYHPAMQADYFRLCYLFVKGGFYVDADDVCVGKKIQWLFEDGRLKIQPLCYDVASNSMISPSVFLEGGANNQSWIFYFNNNPLIAAPGHPIIESALRRATNLLGCYDGDELPEIQETTGPGNLSKSIFDFSNSSSELTSDLVVLRDWDSIAVSQWPLSYRGDARNWRLSNQKKYFR